MSLYNDAILNGSKLYLAVTLRRMHIHKKWTKRVLRYTDTDILRKKNIYRVILDL